MTDQTQELMFEILKNLQGEVRMLREGQRDIKEELIAVRLHQHAAQGELNALLSRMGGVENRLERIERRLDIVSEPAN
ncbi:hypothetical protein [Roseitalea porphyridii]|uniref:Uncharacterized protein n=1 Tax=Roseitalea porphyridii TaxID=1852022 RepID=A0A4P6UZC5_9HYPH|nr:hypothetical protein [Roseitalea porphyridii]QBK30411.1 hypothetical protein E0E05_07245 [Roseitalea porphyridii]